MRTLVRGYWENAKTIYIMDIWNAEGKGNCLTDTNLSGSTAIRNTVSLADTAHTVVCKSHRQPQRATELRHKKAWRPRGPMTPETQEIP